MSMIQLRVSNSGIEIPTDELPRIFDHRILMATLEARWDWARIGVG